MTVIKAEKLRTWGFPARLVEGACIDVKADPIAAPNPYISGYGWRIPTRYSVKLADNRWRRVYASCYSNVARLWCNVCGDDVTLDIDTEIALDQINA